MMYIIEIYQIVFIIVVNINDIRCETTIVCNVSSGDLTCSDNKLIHVENISFWMYSGDDRNDMTGMSCGKNLTNGDTGLTPRCNGQTSCIETVDYTPSDCNGTTSAVFNYRCIYRDSAVINMCESSERDGENRFFLTSPGYPQISNNIQGECRCRIRGTDITAITILDLRLVSAMDGTRSSLYIQYGDKTENITSRINTSKTLYNYKLQLPLATTANIMFNSNQINGQKLWLEIDGIALYVSCNLATTSSSLSSQSTLTILSPTISPRVSTTTVSTTYTSTTLPSSIAVKTTIPLPIPSTSTLYSSTKPSSTPLSSHTQTITSSLSTSSNTTTETGISSLLVGIIALSVSNILTLSCFIGFCVYRRRQSTSSESPSIQMGSITQGVAGTVETPNQQTISPNNSSPIHINQSTRQTVTNEYEPLGRRIPTKYEDIGGISETVAQQNISPNISSSIYVNQPTRQTNYEIH